jgi:hypothetical protein
MVARRKNRLVTVKPISPRLHSLIDYGFAAGNLLLPTLLRTSGKSRALFAAFGLTQGTLNAITVQPIAVDQVVPFRIHGLIEKNSAPIYFGVPLLLGLHREPKARAFWLTVGAALVTVYNLTDWDARHTNR